MSQSRDFGPASQEMKAALEQYTNGELVDLLSHLVQIYVVEGALPEKANIKPLGKDGEDLFGRLSFPELILHLQMHLDHREWKQFSVSGDDVWVNVASQRLNLTGRPEPIPPAASSEKKEGEAEPGEQGSGKKEAVDASGGEDGDEGEVFEKDPVQESERFGMLEFD